MPWEIIRDDVARDMRRLAEGFDVVAKVEASAIIAQMYVKTQATVHVMTGRLKASGHISTNSDRFRIESEIVYGGREAYYAVYEKARRAATKYSLPPHDWREPIETFSQQELFKEVLVSWLKRVTHS